MEKAKLALDSWGSFDLDWLQVWTTGLFPDVGVHVAVLVRHLGFWSLNACRVVGRFPAFPEDRRHGFFYGTLQDHAASGEELFAVELDPADDSVWYQIRAVSRPRAALAIAGYPIGRVLQHRFREESAKAVLNAVRENAD
jgi:uncharacterized protein (UPF0548 family)